MTCVTPEARGMLRSLAASTITAAVISTNSAHPGAQIDQLLKFLLHDIVTWGNATSQAAAGTQLGDISIVSDATTHMPAGYMHARCVANKVMTHAAEVITGCNWPAAITMNPHQLATHLAAHMHDSAHEAICEHGELEAIMDNEDLFGIDG